MPYIKGDKRECLSVAIEESLTALRELESDDPDNSMAGNINYLFTSILNKVYTSNRYDEINEAVGVLECCKLELYRRVAAPYEDRKCIENGDAYTGRSPFKAP